MAVKYHINSQQVPDICKAKIKCPFGGTHGTKSEIVKEIERINKTFHDMETKTLKFKGGTAQNTETTEYGCQTVAILNAMGITTDVISNREDLAHGISKLPDKTQNYKKLKEFGRKLLDEPEDDFRIFEARLLGEAVYKHLKKNQGYTDEEIIEKLRQMGTENNKTTVGDVGLDDHDLSLKAHSRTLHTGGFPVTSEILGFDKGTTPMDVPAVKEIEQNTMNYLNENYVSKLENGGTARDSHRFWSLEKEGGEEFFVMKDSKDDKDSIRLNRKVFTDLNEYKKLTKKEQIGFGRYLSTFQNELKKDETYQKYVVDRNNHMINSVISNYEAIKNPKYSKEVAAKFLGIHDKESYYFAVNSSSVTKGHIPSYDGFMNDDNIQVMSIKPLPNKEHFVIAVANKTNKTYTEVKVRLRYNESQFVYSGLRYSSEYKMSRSGLTPAVVAFKGEQYKFLPLTESLFNYDEKD